MNWLTSRNAINTITRTHIYNGKMQWDATQMHKFLLGKVKLTSQMPQISWKYDKC